MNYNNGKALNINEVQEIEKAIEDFSEGNLYLQKLLLECHRRNIKTHACCKGHQEKEQLPYISFVYSEENEQFIYYIMLKLKDLGISFMYNKLSITNSFMSLEFTEYNEKCFEAIIEAVTSFDNTKNYYLELSSDLKNYFNIINSIEYSNIIYVDNKIDSDYFQFMYNEENGIVNYNIVVRNQDMGRLLRKAGFNYTIQEFENFYHIESNERKSINEKLETLNSFLNKKIGKLSIPEGIESKNFQEMDICFEYNDNVNRNQISQIKVNLGDRLEDIAIKLAICRAKGVYAYAIFNNKEINNYNSFDPNEILKQYNETKGKSK